MKIKHGMGGEEHHPEHHDFCDAGGWRVSQEGEEEYGRRARAENMTGGQGREGIAWRNDGGYPLRYSFGDMPTCSRKNFPSDDWLLKWRSLAISFMVFVVLRSRRRISSDV